MRKEATLQVRIDAELKDKVEKLYRSLGTSFAEAVRIFARQSLEENGMPFVPRAGRGSALGIAAKYANPESIKYEKDAFARAMVEKHGSD